MLTKCVVGEEDLVVLGIRDHVVWPVDHWRLHKGQGAFTNVERIARLYAVDVDILAIESLELLDALRCACVDLGVWRELQNARNAAGVVHLNVVTDQNVNLCWIDDALDALDQLLGKWALDGVNERDLLVQDKVCIVGNALLSGVAVELASIPVKGAYKVDIGFDFDRTKHVSSKDHSAKI